MEGMAIFKGEFLLQCLVSGSRGSDLGLCPHLNRSGKLGNAGAICVHRRHKYFFGWDGQFYRNVGHRVSVQGISDLHKHLKLRKEHKRVED